MCSSINKVIIGLFKKIPLFIFLFIFFSAKSQTSIVIIDGDSTILTTKEITVDTTRKNPLRKKLLVVSDSIQKDSINTLLNNTSTKKKQKKIDTTHYSPKKAAIWGAACPGLGQIYMKKYWKLPIVYGILGTTLYFVASNGKKLKEFNGYLRNLYDSIPNPEPYTDLSISEVEYYRDNYRKNVQLASFGTIFAWGLSIVDAVVDAHLHDFDISDNLSFKIKPSINYTNQTYYTGIGVKLNFK